MNASHIHQVLSNLATKYRAFWSEADFQFAFAWELQKLCPMVNIHLERRVSLQTNCYVDIWVEKDNKIYPIELKYKTKVATIGGISLLNQSAVDFGCYDYLWDIYRLEQLLSQSQNFDNGFAIMLTNDAAYFKNTQRKSAYDAFKIFEEAIKQGHLSWGNTTKGTTFVYGKRNPFTLNGMYTMQWHDCNQGQDGFKYLINEVK